MDVFSKLKEIFTNDGLEDAITYARDLEGDFAYLLTDTLIQAGPVLGTYPDEFETQLIGRLAENDDADAVAFVAAARATLPVARLEPIGETFFDDVDNRVLHTWVAHDDFVGGLGIAPDGDRLVSSSEDGDVRQFSIGEKSFVRSLDSYHGGMPINHLGISSDGRLATAGDDYKIKVAPLDGAEPRVLARHTNYVSRVAWCGDKLVSVSKDQHVALWDLEADNPCLSFRDEHGGWVYVLAVKPDGSRFATSSVNNKMVLWDGETGEPIKAFVGEDAGEVHYVMGDLYIGGTNSGDVGHERAPYSMVWSNDGSFLVSAENDIIVWDATDDAFTEKFRLPGHAWGAKALVVFDDDKKLLSLGKSIKVWDLESQKELSSTETPDGNEIRSAAIASDESVVVAGDGNGNIWMFDVNELSEFRGRPHHNGIVYPISFSSDSRYAVSGSSDGSALVFSLRDGAFVSKLQGFGRMFVNTVGFRNDATEVVACSDGEMLIFDTETGERKKRIEGPNSIYSFTWQDIHPSEKFAIGGAPIAKSSRWDFEADEVVEFETQFSQPSSGVWVRNGDEIVLNAYDEKQAESTDECAVTRWDSNDVTLQQTYHLIGGRSDKGYFEYAGCIDVDPDERWVFGGSSQGRVYAWDFESGERVLSDQAFDEYVGLASYVGDNKVAFVCANTREIALYDLDKKQPCGRFEVETNLVRNVSRSPDGQWAAAVVEDHTVALIDLLSGELIATFSSPSELWRAQISPDGQVLVVGTKDGHVLPLRIRIP